MSHVAATGRERNTVDTSEESQQVHYKLCVDILLPNKVIFLSGPYINSSAIPRQFLGNS